MLTHLDMGPKVLNRVAPGVESAPYELFELTPKGATIGAQIDGIDMRAALPAEVLAEVHRALLEWKVLFFRNQPITPEQHVAFARQWGELEIHPALGQGAIPELVRFEKGEGSPKDVKAVGYENLWHSDVSWREVPSLGSILHCIDGPVVGGDTLWADMYAVYDQLSADFVERIEGRTATHSFARAFLHQLPPDQRAAAAAKYPDEHHPVIRTHPETGRKLVYVNPVFTVGIDGLDDSESDRILSRLYALTTAPEFQVRWNWSPDDVAFWDNRSTQHYACSDYHPARRVMERATIIGTRPY